MGLDRHDARTPTQHRLGMRPNVRPDVEGQVPKPKVLSVERPCADATPIRAQFSPDSYPVQRKPPAQSKPKIRDTIYTPSSHVPTVQACTFPDA